MHRCVILVKIAYDFLNNFLLIFNQFCKILLDGSKQFTFVYDRFVITGICSVDIPSATHPSIFITDFNFSFGLPEEVSAITAFKQSAEYMLAVFSLPLREFLFVYLHLFLSNLKGIYIYNRKIRSLCDFPFFFRLINSVACQEILYFFFAIDNNSAVHPVGKNSANSVLRPFASSLCFNIFFVKNFRDFACAIFFVYVHLIYSANYICFKGVNI